MAKRVTFVALSLFFLFPLFLAGQVVVPFTHRLSPHPPHAFQEVYHIRGDFSLIGNKNQTHSNQDVPNNSGRMIYVDVDEDLSTVNSSSATLQFSTENNADPQCSKVVYAGLYWTGRAHDTQDSPMDFPAEFNTVHTNGNTLNNYHLSISQVDGSTGGREATYTFSPVGGGDNVVFTFTNTNQASSVTVRVGAGEQQGVPSTFAGDNPLTATFNAPLVVNTGNTEIRVLGLAKNPWSNTIYSINFFANIAYETGKQLNKLQVKLKHQDQDYITVNANTDNIFFPTSGYDRMYSAYADITTYVQQHGAGEYTVADIALREGNGGGVGYYGGWGMAVVYENSRMKWRDVSVFDGYTYIQHQSQGNETYGALDVSGFQAVQSGDVNIKLGMMAGEGDMGITGDFFDIRNANDTQWVRLSHGGNQPNNFFNSSIYTGNNPRNPNDANNYGMDISMFEIPNANNSIIANNQSSTRFRYGTSQDVYIIFFIAIAVDAFVPDIEPMHQVVSVNGVPVDLDNPPVELTIEPGQEIEFRVEIRNRDTEPINDFSVSIPLYFTTIYESSIAEYFQGLSGPQPVYDPLAGPNGTIVWNVGHVPIPAHPDDLLARLTYTLRVSEDCFILANQNCEPEVSMQGTISGIGEITQISFSNQPFIQGYVDGGDCEDEPISDPLRLVINRQDFIDLHCTPLEDYQTRQILFCSQGETTVPFLYVSEQFPGGSRFFNSIDENTGEVSPTAQEFSITNPFPATAGVSTYYGLPVGDTGCWWRFTVEVIPTSVSQVGQQTRCFQDEVLLTHFTTGVIGIGVPENLPENVFASFNGNDITIAGIPAQAGTYHYTIPLFTPCATHQGLQAVGTIVVQGDVLPGQIQESQQLCPEATPATIISSVNGSGTGTISYRWETSTVGADVSFETILNASGPTLLPTNLDFDAWYRRTAFSTQNGVVCESNPSNVVEVSYNDPILLDNISVTDVHCKRKEEGGSILLDVGGGVALPVEYFWSNGSTMAFLSGVPPGDYSVTIVDANGCVVEESFFVDYLDEDCQVVVPGGFSPNKDDINDTWVVENLMEHHPGNRVMVFNRNGTLVYDASPYSDDWDGTPNQGNVLVGKDGKLPPGVYFYLIWLDPGSQPLTGSVFISY